MQKKREVFKYAYTYNRGASSPPKLCTDGGSNLSKTEIYST